MALEAKAFVPANNDPDAWATMLRRVTHEKISQLHESLSSILGSSGQPFVNFPKDNKAEALAKELARMYSASARAARLREEVESTLGGELNIKTDAIQILPRSSRDRKLLLDSGD